VPDSPKSGGDFFSPEPASAPAPRVAIKKKNTKKPSKNDVTKKDEQPAVAKPKKRKAAAMTPNEEGKNSVSARTRGSNAPVIKKPTQGSHATVTKKRKTMSNARVAQSVLWGLQPVGQKRVLLLGSSPVAPLCNIDNTAQAFFDDSHEYVVISHDITCIYKSVFCLPAVLRGAKFVKNADFDRQKLSPRNDLAWAAQNPDSSLDFFRQFEIYLCSGLFNFHNQVDCTNSPGTGSHLRANSHEVLLEFLNRQKAASGYNDNEHHIGSICIVGNACHAVVRRLAKQRDVLYVHFRIFFRVLQYGFDLETMDVLLDGLSMLGDYPPICFAYCTCNLRPHGSECPEKAPWFKELPTRIDVTQFRAKLDEYVAEVESESEEEVEHDNRSKYPMPPAPRIPQKTVVQEENKKESDDDDEIAIRYSSDSMEVAEPRGYESPFDPSEFGISLHEPWSEAYAVAPHPKRGESFSLHVASQMPFQIHNWDDVDSFADEVGVMAEYGDIDHMMDD
tara:strand:+ start:2858 stop:4369 length:1512 start_codon:yes stop_codon:yes gene_type:complete